MYLRKSVWAKSLNAHTDLATLTWAFTLTCKCGLASPRSG